MLVQFRVENHRSLRDEQVLSMVASGSADAPGLLAPDGLSEALLPAVALYGANASGKTNVLHALAFMSDAVVKSHRLWEPGGGPPRESFALSERAGEPSLYELDFLHHGVRYRYGFVLGPERVEEEWLHAWPRGRKQVWFEREAHAFDFGKHLGGENETIQKVTRDNSLFLSAAAQNNHGKLSPIFEWFQSAQFELRRAQPATLEPRHTVALERMFADPRQESLFKLEEDAVRQRQRASVIRLLRAADIGIREIKLRPRDPDRTRRARFQFLHDSAEKHGTWLPMEAESAGTLTLLGLAAGIVDVLQRGSLFCVDELESSLHPALALELLRLFHDREHNPKGAQLLFTTHDTNLLGNVLGAPPLRRDQIWFTEKDPHGATHLYPLTDFHPRKEENLERGYLQGRYGAIPFLGDFRAKLGEREGT